MMKKLVSRITMFLWLLLFIIFCFAVGRSLYRNWVEWRRVNELTELYGEELFAAVQGHHNAFSVSGYISKEQLSWYTTHPSFSIRRRIWDEANQGQKVHIAEADSDEVEVIRYSEDMAKLIIWVRWKAVIYSDLTNRT